MSDPIPFEYTRAAIYLQGTFEKCAQRHLPAYMRGFNIGRRSLIHTFYSLPHERCKIATEIRRMRAADRQEKAA